MNWNERTVNYPYPAAFKERYGQGSLSPQGNLFLQWYERYKEGNFLFYDGMLNSNVYPHDGPVTNLRGFHELLVGMMYLDAGYDVLCDYQNEAREKAEELLGGDAAVKKIITNLQCCPQPPDLLVFCPKTNRFRFVECKGENEKLKPTQKKFFPEVEDYLSKNRPPCEVALADPGRADLFPPLLADQWIHIARLVPVKMKV